MVMRPLVKLKKREFNLFDDSYQKGLLTLLLELVLELTTYQPYKAKQVARTWLSRIAFEVYVVI